MRIALVLGLAILLAGCQAPSPTPARTPSPTPLVLIVAGDVLELPPDTSIGGTITSVTCGVGRPCPKVPLWTLRRHGAMLTVDADGQVHSESWPPGEEDAFAEIKPRFLPSLEPPPLPAGQVLDAAPKVLHSFPRLEASSPTAPAAGGAYAWSMRWADPDGSGGWVRYVGEPELMVYSIRSALPARVRTGTQVQLTLDPPPAALEVFDWLTAVHDPVRIGSTTSLHITAGRHVFDIRARWDYGAAAQGTASYLLSYEGVP